MRRRAAVKGRERRQVVRGWARKRRASRPRTIRPVAWRPAMAKPAATVHQKGMRRPVRIPPEEAGDVEDQEEPEVAVHLGVVGEDHQPGAGGGEGGGEDRGAAGDDLAGEEVHGRDHERAGGGGDEAHHRGGEGEPAGEEPVEFVVEGDEAVGAEDGEEV